MLRRICGPNSGFDAALGVPEKWRFDGEYFEMDHLDESDDVEASVSLAFPFLRADVMTDIIGQTLRSGRRAGSLQSMDSATETLKSLCLGAHASRVCTQAEKEP
jgi:hypothetical protein